MGMFGAIGAGLKKFATPENLYLLGATLKDIGDGGSDNFMAAQKGLETRRKSEQQAAATRQLLQSLGMGGDANGGGVPGAPTADGQPARRGLPTMRDAGPALLAAHMAGVPGIGDIAALLDKAGPDIAEANGVTYDRRATAPGSKIGVNLTDVGGFQIDKQDLNNVDRFVPKIDAGATPLYDAQRNIVGQRLLDGTLKMRGDVAQAETAGRTGATLYKVPRGDGSEAFMTGSQFLGGAGSQVPGGAGGGTGGPAGGRSGPALGVTQSPGDAAYDKEMAGTAADQYKTIQTAGSQASAKTAQLRQIDALLGDFEGGKFAPLGLEIASGLNSLGWKMDPKMSNAQAADALAKQLALEMRNPAGGAGMPGALSNSDRDYLTKTVPGLIQSSAGRRQMVNIAQANFARQADVAAKARQWQQRFGRIDKADASGKTFQDYLQLYADKHPLYGTQ